MPETRARSKTPASHADDARKESPARKLRVLMENIPAPHIQSRKKHTAGKQPKRKSTQNNDIGQNVAVRTTNDPKNPTRRRQTSKVTDVHSNTNNEIDSIESTSKDTNERKSLSQRRQSKKVSYKETSNNESSSERSDSEPRGKRQSRSRKRAAPMTQDTSEDNNGTESEEDHKPTKRKPQPKKSNRVRSRTQKQSSENSSLDVLEQTSPAKKPAPPQKPVGSQSSKPNSTKKATEKSCPIKLSPKKSPIKARTVKPDIRPHGEAVKALLQAYEKPSTSKTHHEAEVMSGSDDSEDDWEEVADVVHSSPKKDMQVTVEDTSKGKKKKGFDWTAYSRRLWNRFQKEQHEAIHNFELICLLVRGQWMNQFCSEGLLKAVSLSLYPKPNSLRGKASNLTNVNKTLGEISTKYQSIKLKNPFKHDENGTDIERLGENMAEEPTSHIQVVALLVAVFRHLGSNVRLVQSLYPREYRISQYNKLKRKEQQAKLKQDNDEAHSKKSKGKAPLNAKKEVKEQYWLEVYLKDEKRWLPIDASFTIYEQYTDLEKHLQLPTRYVISYDNEGGVKEIIQKYDSNWMTSTRKLRTKQEWWEKTLKPYFCKKSKLSKEEDQLIQDVQEKMPFPKSIGEFKNHPLYALERHMLKFEAIYPPTAVPLGYTKTKTNEAIYARECVKQLHSRETWLKDAKQVKVGEKPYKYVKPRPRLKDVQAKIKITEATLPVFGEWQTEQFVPPTAENGKVPRNPYGNVELFRPEMLPKGCVHIPINGVGKLCRRLDIDCAQAMIGWEAHSGYSCPQFDGWVICSEFKDTVMGAWKEFDAEQQAKADAKIEKRIYGNWRTLIKGLLIRERLRSRYGQDTF